MEIRQLKALACQRVKDAPYSARMLALLFVGATAVLSFVITLVSFLLSRQMEGTGGLGGIGTRAMLSAIQMTVMLGGAVMVPFWNLGYTRAALNTARGDEAVPATLLEGFRLFFPALRLFFLQAALLLVLLFIGVQVGTILYMLTPVSGAAMEMIEQLLAAGEAALTDPAATKLLVQAFWPMYALILLVLLVLFIPVLYRLRLVEFSLVDGQHKALRNMAQSNVQMWGKCFWMFRLDLSFWWYFLLQLLTAALAYGDLLVGGGDVAYWAFYLVSAGAQLALGWWYLPRVQTTYALAYDEITKKDSSPKVNPNV